MATAATATRRGIQGPRCLCQEKLVLLGVSWDRHFFTPALANVPFLPLHGTGVSVPAWAGDRSSHLCLAALGAAELGSALPQPRQAGLVLLAQRLQLRAQLRALRAQRGGVPSSRGPLGSLHTQGARAAAVAAALHLQRGTAQLCCPSVLGNLQGQSTAQRYCGGCWGSATIPHLPALLPHSQHGEKEKMIFTARSEDVECRLNLKFLLHFTDPDSNS